MGCAPSSEEKSMWNSEEKNRLANSLYNDVSKKWNQFESLIKKLKEEFKNDTALYTELTTLFPNTKKPELNLKGLPGAGDPENFYSYLSDLGYTADKNLDQAKQLELLLCDLQCKFYNLHSKHQELKSSRHLSEINTALSNYKDHREDDKASWISWLNQQKEFAQTTVDFGEKRNKKRAKDHIKKIEEEIKRIENLNIEDVLINNSSFARNKEEFDASENIYK